MLKGLIKKQIHLIYTNNLIRGIAWSLFGIFVPIYFLTLGFPLRQIFIYFLVFQSTTFISFTIIGRSACIILSAVFMTVFVIMLSLLNLEKFPVYIIGIVGGMSDAFYFLPLHAFFVKTTEKDKKGTQFGIYSIFGQLSGLFGPLIGALIVLIFSFQYLFIFVILFIIISLIPLSSLNNFKPKEKITFKKFKEFSKKHKGFFFATIVDNIKGEIEGNIWPIFVFLVLQNLISIGWVSFLITAGTMIFTFFLGKHFDKKSRYLMMRIGAVLYATIWIVRGFIDSSIFIYASSLLVGFFGLMLSVPFTAIFYKKIDEEKDSDSFIVLSEIPNFIGRAVLWSSAIIFQSSFKMFFIIAGICGLSFAFWKMGLKEEKN